MQDSHSEGADYTVANWLNSTHMVQYKNEVYGDNGDKLTSSLLMHPAA